MADLAARLTKRLADKNRNSNLVFSPLSIYAVLALLASGAGGHTLEEVLRVLGARSRRELEDSVARLREGPLRDTSESDGPSVAFAYGVWSDLMRPMMPAYQRRHVQGQGQRRGFPQRPSAGNTADRRLGRGGHKESHHVRRSSGSLHPH
ncbi:hypothetical protein ACQ4PT_053499 [Festuca glaucescens]